VYPKPVPCGPLLYPGQQYARTILFWLCNCMYTTDNNYCYYAYFKIYSVYTYIIYTYISTRVVHTAVFSFLLNNRNIHVIHIYTDECVYTRRGHISRVGDNKNFFIHILYIIIGTYHFWFRGGRLRLCVFVYGIYNVCVYIYHRYV